MNEETAKLDMNLHESLEGGGEDMEGVKKRGGNKDNQKFEGGLKMFLRNLCRPLVELLLTSKSFNLGLKQGYWKIHS